MGGAKTKKQEANNGEHSFQEKRDLPAIYMGHERTHTKNYSVENKKKGTRLKVNKREKYNVIWDKPDQAKLGVIISCMHLSLSPCPPNLV